LIAAFATSLPKSCFDLKAREASASGVYAVYLPNGTQSRPEPMKVYCYMETDGGGWLVSLQYSVEWFFR
jgi:hypothetical protein